MYKIEIKWGFRSPSLQVLTGEVRIGQIDMGLLDPEDHKPFQVKKERNSRGYENCPAVFSRCKPLIDLVVDSYYAGMLMSDESHEWFRGCSRHNNIVTVTMHD